MKKMTIFLHGALGSAAQFDLIRPFLPENAPFQALNLPGHGGLPIGDSFSLDLFAEALLEATKSAPVRLFGYSMGGYAALYFAWKYPERVSEIITLNTKLDWSPEVAARMQGMMNAEKIEAKAPQMAARMAATHAPQDWKIVANRTIALLHDFGNGNGLPDAAFAAINCPVTLLRGDQDGVVSAEECRRVAALLPKATYHEIRESGHLLEQVKVAELLTYLS